MMKDLLPFNKLAEVLKKYLKKVLRIYQILRDHSQYKQIGYISAFINIYKNKNLNYSFFGLETAKKFVKSDTIFILGSGPPLNSIKRKHMDVMSRYDTFGINYSFLKDEIVPQFYQAEFGRSNWARETFRKLFSLRRETYRNTVFCLSYKELYRMAHPKITPMLFPLEAKIYLYRLSKPILLERARPFCDSDFDKTIYYRGTLTLVLNIALSLGYRKIILMGVDPDKAEHFFDNLPEMKEYVYNINNYIKSHNLKQYESMIPKGNKFNSIDDYLYSLRNYLLRKRGIELYIGFKDSMLYPRIPAYFD